MIAGVLVKSVSGAGTRPALARMGEAPDTLDLVTKLSHRTTVQEKESMRAVTRKLAIGALVSAGLFVAASAAQARDCIRDGWIVSLSSPDATIHWTVRRGAVCTSLNRPDPRHSAIVDGFSVLRRAQRGNAAVTNGLADRGFAYRAPNSYVGEDEFQIGCVLRSRGAPEPVHCSITVKVTVVDHP